MLAFSIVLARRAMSEMTRRLNVLALDESVMLPESQKVPVLSDGIPGWQTC